VAPNEHGQPSISLTVARKLSNVSWRGFTHDQAELLDSLDHLGNNGWARNSQTNELMLEVR
jgi:hypothetical protein